MGDRTKIDWADATWNPVTGCLHGCEYCYARRIAQRFDAGMEEWELVIHHDPEDWDKPLMTKPMRMHVLDKPMLCRDRETGRTAKAAYPFGFEPTFHRYRLEEPERWLRPRTIFVCSMADLFGEWVPDEWIEAVFDACLAAPQHRYLFLTKNPRRYTRLYKAGKLPNTIDCWWGASTPHMDDPYNIGMKTFASIEPILEDFSETAEVHCEWIIIGAETGNRKGKVIPEKAWIQPYADVCREAGVPVFMKESLRGIMGEDFRQEFPWET